MIKETIFNIVKEFDKYSGPEDDAAFVSNAQYTLDQLRYLTRVIIEINRNTYSESMIAELEKALRECHEKKKDCDQLLQKECQNILNSRLEEVDVRNELNKAYADGQEMYNLGKGGTLLTDIKLILTYTGTSLLLCYCSYDNIFPNAYNPIKSGLADIKDRLMKDREQSKSITEWIAYGKEFIFPKRDENMEYVEGLAREGANAADLFTNPATGIINLWKYELIHEVLTTTEEIEQKEMEVSMCMDIVVLRCLRKIKELIYEDALPTIIEGMLNSMPELKKDVQEQANILSEARGAGALGEVQETMLNGTRVPAGLRTSEVQHFQGIRPQHMNAPAAYIYDQMKDIFGCDAWKHVSKHGVGVSSRLSELYCRFTIPHAKQEADFKVSYELRYTTPENIRDFIMEERDGSAKSFGDRVMEHHDREDELDHNAGFKDLKVTYLQMQLRNVGIPSGKTKANCVLKLVQYYDHVQMFLQMRAVSFKVIDDKKTHTIGDWFDQMEYYKGSLPSEYMKSDECIDRMHAIFKAWNTNVDENDIYKQEDKVFNKRNETLETRVSKAYTKMKKWQSGRK
ncbi:hypothetical protein CYMTET_41318 [Cymbomonas tetramitiformis]|uniref:SAP domain-containing protein n=1 Tax=Cymbomonas tetramitiformis TaxID=36881 RepID=A0AAE0C6E4_9CHLO|nr:hypothetical protein CYMTET_44656 [Cymbomonas tetramitiformis]KAK3249242.1 hypothetical protein CYMTET_41318 [Cymbomonas tetramitiformis]